MCSNCAPTENPHDTIDRMVNVPGIPVWAGICTSLVLYCQESANGDVFRWSDRPVLLQSAYVCERTRQRCPAVHGRGSRCCHNRVGVRGGTFIGACARINLLTIVSKAKVMNSADGATNKDMRDLIRYINASLRECAPRAPAHACTFGQAKRTHATWPTRWGVCGSATLRLVRDIHVPPRPCTWRMRSDNFT
jgi:hypothetical protein